MSESRSLSPWWCLAILPVALVIGWYVGQVEGLPPRPVKPAETQDAATVPASVEPDQAPAMAIGRQSGDGYAARSTVVETPGPQPPAEISSWTSYDNALSESKRNGKPVLIDFSADWCPPCQALKRDVFMNWAHGQAVQTAVIPVAIIDRRREDGANPSEIESLQERYQVQAFPTLIVFSPETGRSVRHQGFGNAEAIVDWITQAAKSVR